MQRMPTCRERRARWCVFLVDTMAHPCCLGGGVRGSVVVDDVRNQLQVLPEAAGQLPHLALHWRVPKKETSFGWPGREYEKSAALHARTSSVAL